MLLASTIAAVVSGIAAKSSFAPSPAKLDVVLLIGFMTSAFAMLFCFMQRESRRHMLGFAITSSAMAVFGFMVTGAWPLGMVQIACAITAWWHWREAGRQPARMLSHSFSTPRAHSLRTHRLPEPGEPYDEAWTN